MWLQRADFDAAGNLLRKTNLTQPDEGIGYTVLHPTGSAVLFSTELSNGDVETYALNLTTPNAQPVEFLADISGLLTPCKGDAVPCMDGSTFHTTWTPAGDRVAFAYRVWDNEGTGVGNQAIGLANADGSNMTPLTFINDNAGWAVIDMCPTPVAGNDDLLFFTRTPDQVRVLLARQERAGANAEAARPDSGARP